MGLRGFLTTLALGAGGMYLLDPERGDQRREELTKHFERYSRDAESIWRDGVSDLQHRVGDVRQKAQTVKEEGVQQVTGVARQAAGNLQQAAQGVNATGEGMQTRMSGNGNGGQMAPGPRLLAITGGSLLTLYGRTQRGLKGGAFTALGMNLLTKGFANKSLPQIVQRAKGGNLEVHKTLMIDAPADEVYRFWRNYDNFPRFMSHLEAVHDMGGGRSHWVAKGPVGTPVEWHARITAEEPSRLLAWESEPDSQVYNRGQVKFQEMGGRTQVVVHMSYTPPGGMAGHAVAALFGSDPKTAMDHDLDKLKTLFEAGSVEAEGKRVSKTEVTGGGSGSKGGQTGKGQQGGSTSSAGSSGGTSTPRTSSGGESRPMGQYGEGQELPGKSDMPDGGTEPPRKKPGTDSGQDK